MRGLWSMPDAAPAAPVTPLDWKTSFPSLRRIQVSGRVLAGLTSHRTFWSESAEAFDESLAVVGRNGTLYRRMRGTAAQDRCHAKTGTLHDVSTLAGYCDSLGGDKIAFAFMMNRTNPAYAHVLQDKMTVELARYETG